MIANLTDNVSTIRSQTSYILEDRRDHHGATITVLTLRPVMLVVVMMLLVMMFLVVMRMLLLVMAMMFLVMMSVLQMTLRKIPGCIE